MGKNFKVTSWQKVAPWYNKITGEKGHYYHQHIIIPKLLRLLKLQDDSNLLDLGCGNGVLAKHLPKSVRYTGIDIAPSLINEAKRTDHNPHHRYFIGDITKSLNSQNLPNTLINNDFTHAAIILALQNTPNPLNFLKNASTHLLTGSNLVIVLNHPAFRIPRQSSWEIDENKKTQFRRVDRYMSPMEIPINMNPSDRNSEKTMSYHFPLSYYSSILGDSGFLIEKIEEWTSDKESQGLASRMENRARNEFPLFMAIKARKI